MKNVKSIFHQFLVLMVLIGIFSFQNHQNSHETIKKSNLLKPNPMISAYLSGWSKSSGCFKGKGNCGVCLTDFPVDNTNCSVNVSLDTESSQLIISNNESFVNEDGNSVTIDQPVTIPSSITEQLGKSSIIIQPGQYTIITTGSNSNGVLSVSVVYE